MKITKEYLNRLADKIITETLEEKANEVMKKIKPSEFDYIEEGEMCECGSPMVEGECKECGKVSDELMEKLYGGQKKLDKNKNNKIDSEDFKMLRGEMDEDECTECGEMREGEMCECGSTEFYEDECVECGKMKGEFMEYATGSNPFTGGMDEEVEEGNAFTDALRKTPEGGKFKLGNKEYTDNSNLDETLYRLVDGKDSALFTENEIIDIIENIIREEKEKDNIKKGVQHKGTSTYEKAHKGSGKENKEYLDSVAKKMTDYIKDGSKGKYETNPKHFPKGNGELAKMDKKAYEVSTDGEEFIDDFLRPGMQTLDYDEMHPNEEWMDDIIQGSSRTGNSDEYANAEQTEVNKKLNKTRKKGNYNKLKRQAYNKAPQPVVSDKPGQEKGKGLHLKLEGTNERQTEKLNEEFERIQELMGYTQKTQ